MRFEVRKHPSHGSACCSKSSPWKPQIKPAPLEIRCPQDWQSNGKTSSSPTTVPTPGLSGSPPATPPCKQRLNQNEQFASVVFSSYACHKGVGSEATTLQLPINGNSCFGAVARKDRPCLVVSSFAPKV